MNDVTLGSFPDDWPARDGPVGVMIDIPAGLAPGAADWPTLYIVGAPKCGTTALAHYLSEHRQIAFSRPKEPHFFATDMPRMRIATSAEDYLALFPGQTGGTQVRAEGSVWYLYSETAIPNILSVSPQARFIVMLRNPIDAAHALYTQKLKSLDEDCPSFEKAFRLEDERRAGRAIPQTCRTPKTILYGDTCRYGAQLERLLRLVDRSRVKIILFDDFCRDAGRAYRDVLDFAGLPDDGRTSFPRVNESSRVLSQALNRLLRRPSLLRKALARPVKKLIGVRHLGVSAAIKRLNTVKASRSPLSPAFRAELAGYFADDVTRLATLIERDLSAWMEGAPIRQASISRPVTSSLALKKR